MGQPQPGHGSRRRHEVGVVTNDIRLEDRRVQELATKAGDDARVLQAVVQQCGGDAHVAHDGSTDLGLLGSSGLGGAPDAGDQEGVLDDVTELLASGRKAGVVQDGQSSVAADESHHEGGDLECVLLGLDGSDVVEAVYILTDVSEHSLEDRRTTLANVDAVESAYGDADHQRNEHERSNDNEHGQLLRVEQAHLRDASQRECVICYTRWE